MQKNPACKQLVLDAGPLLSLSPLRGLAETYITAPQVLDELKDRRAREHFERLGLSAGVRIEVRAPDAAALAHVIQFAKKTGDYSVLSHADLCVLALTYALDLKAKAEASSERAKAAEGDRDADVPAEPKALAELSDALQNTALKCADPHATTESAGNSDLNDSNEHQQEQEEGTGEETKIDVADPDVQKQAEGAGYDVQENHPVTEPSSAERPNAEIIEPPGDDTEAHPPPTDHEPTNAEQLNAHEVAGNPGEHEPLEVALEHITDDATRTPRAQQQGQEVIFEDPSDSDDGEGEWITPANVGVYKSRALDLLPSSDAPADAFTVVLKKKRGKQRRAQGGAGEGAGEGGGARQIGVGCMTADFAMQNVLLQMGLSLVGVEGRRIEKVKSWVLRCHACFKICKDSAKKFCPTCGNATLLRTSVTARAPGADGDGAALEVHLKKNFAYRTRGSVYSIPAPQPGSAKRGPGTGLVLREDQTEYVRAAKKEEGRREREARRLVAGALANGVHGEEGKVAVGSWMDPDWVPGIMSVGIGGKGRSLPDSRIGTDGMPVIGHGRKNPNERRRKK